MEMNELEVCPDCGVKLPKMDGPTHRYIGGSASCWAMFANLANGGEPPVASALLNVLLVDAYAAQHPGRESPQATQSVVVHVLTLYGILERGYSPNRAVWMRTKPLQVKKGQNKHDRFEWLEPPDLTGRITIADIVAQPTPEARAEKMAEYVADVLAVWMESYGARIVDWFERYVVAGR